MDTWKFYAVTHTDHVVCNPTSVEVLDELIGLLDLPPTPRILDIGAGKGEFLIRTVEQYGGPRGAGVCAIAVDPSPYCVADLRAAATRRVPDAQVDVLELAGADYPAQAGAFDLAMCLGATWAFGGYGGTLRALTRAARPGGLVLVGEPYWRQEPAAAYLEWSGMQRGEFGTHAGNVATGADEGLVPLLAWESSQRDWERYETLQWRAVARYAVQHPEDPDVAEIVTRVERARHEYLTWGRETLGWALYLFARPA